MKLHKITYFLLLAGGLNWGLEGLFYTGISDWLPYGLTRLIYILIGAAAVYELAGHTGVCKECETIMKRK